MTTFIQLHLLTSYPPANLNRDDLGRPKTAVMGGVQRLRVSSQSLKRAWRTSELFQRALDGHVGTRTKEMGSRVVLGRLTEAGIPKDDAEKWAQAIAVRFGKLKGTGGEIEQLAHFSPTEVAAVGTLTATIIAERRAPREDELDALLQAHQAAADIALFGRMLAANPAFNIEAAAQVAHAISVHKVAIEDDYFTAVDDLNRCEEDMGAGHIGEIEFAAGLFYLYVCVDRDLLRDNLQGDEALTTTTLQAITEAAATVAPTGKQNSFASRAYASYLLAEKGTCQPRSLAVAFLMPVSGQDMMTNAIATLNGTRMNMDKVYDARNDVEPCIMNAVTGEGSLKNLLRFVSEPLPAKKNPS
ncbi:MAG TPA: type I-E CRISPR-associated protein Cas7/Cse4/CasC [Verrucomicrobiota bacterium]|nr:type I-E CRISPR-associated protein Cas7/Cse4/CasC [Verrucomicrobiota bacterium]